MHTCMEFCLFFHSLSTRKFLDLNIMYKNKSFQGAKFMFECVWKYLKEVLFADPPGPPPTARQVSLSNHEAFMATRTGLYVGGDTLIENTDSFIEG